MTCPKLVSVPNQAVRGPVLLVVMDGVGIGRGDAGDAVKAARKPNLDRYAKSPLQTQLAAHGLAVGMPSDEDMGNSEVGHNALGSGRVFDQGAKLVSGAIETGRLFEGKGWRGAIEQVRTHKTPLHFIGLLSDGNVHSHIDHLIAMLRHADKDGVTEVYVHPLLDGRDVPKTSAMTYVDQLEAVLAELRKKPNRRYLIASGGGRMTTTMDRYEADWSMVERGWKTHVLGQGRGFASAKVAIETFRADKPGINDQDLPAFVIVENGKPVGPIRDGAAVIAFNFRGDRMLELTRAFEDEPFAKFARGKKPDVYFAGMMLYDGDTHRPGHYLVEPPEIRCTSGELLAQAGITQLACSETQKYGHVTYFWNGNRTGMFDEKLEHYIEVPSWPAPFDARPEMRAVEITDMVLKELATGKYCFSRLNFANGDMVGHTGNFAAVVKSVECVDACLARLEKAVLAAGGALIVTADHGNADDMLERDKKTGQLLKDAAGVFVPKTSHSLNPVPFYVLMAEAEQKRFRMAGVERPGLGNVAATVLALLGFQKPQDYLPSLLAVV